MKKILPIVIVVALLAVGGYFLLNRPGSNQPQSTAKQLSEASQWASAIASGNPTTCTMTKGEEKMEYLIKGKKMKTTITNVVDTVKNISYMINDEKFFYTWSEGQNEGTKMAIPTTEELKKMTDNKQVVADVPETPNFESENGFGTLKDSGYVINCQATSADDSVFIPPTTIKFIDPTTIMNTLPTQDPNGKIDMSQIEAIKKQFGGEVPANY